MGDEDEREDRMSIGERINYGCVVLGSALIVIATLAFAYNVHCNSH